jgi:hypothetical protein
MTQRTSNQPRNADAPRRPQLPAMVYPINPPFDPPEVYPEFRPPKVSGCQTRAIPFTPLMRNADTTSHDLNVSNRSVNPFGELRPAKRRHKFQISKPQPPRGTAACPAMGTHLRHRLVDYACSCRRRAGPDNHWRHSAGELPASELRNDWAGNGRRLRPRNACVERSIFCSFMTTSYPDGSEQAPLRGDPRGYTSLIEQGSLLQSLEDQQNAELLHAHRSITSIRQVSPPPNKYLAFSARISTDTQHGSRCRSGC